MYLQRCAVHTVYLNVCVLYVAVRVCAISKACSLTQTHIYISSHTTVSERTLNPKSCEEEEEVEDEEDEDEVP